MNVTNHPIINIGAPDTDGGSRGYFELFENGEFHWCWDIDNQTGNNYVDATNVFGDKLTANEWHDINIVVDPQGDFDVLTFSVDDEVTKVIDLTKDALAEVGANEYSKYAGQCVSAYLAITELPVSYGYGAYYWSHLETNDDGYIDDVVIRTNALADINLLLKAMTEYEEKMKNPTVYRNMLPAYTAYIDANKVYDAYYYGGKTNVDIDTAYWHMKLATLDMDAWTPSTASDRGDFKKSDVV